MASSGAPGSGARRLTTLRPRRYAVADCGSSRTLATFLASSAMCGGR